MDWGMIGPGVILALGCIGSAIGCGIGGMAAHGAITHVEEGHGKLIGLSVLPASQTMYCLVLLILMSDKIRAKTLDPFVALGIAIASGLAIMLSAIYQGKAVATAIQASAKQPALYGKCAAAPVIIETFAIFAFVFTLLII